MGYAVKVDAQGMVIGRKQAVVEFDYDAWNAAQDHQRNKDLRIKELLKSKELEVFEERKALRAEYATLGIEAKKLIGDRRLSQSTRASRLAPIIERMLDIEDTLCS